MNKVAGYLALYSFMVFLVGIAGYAILIISWVLSFTGLSLDPLIFHWIWNVSNFIIVFFLLILALRILTHQKEFLFTRRDIIPDLKVIVGIVTYNEEEAIAEVINDFKGQKEVKEVIVIDNNSTDKTSEIARTLGAKVVKEGTQGYGAACLRALRECLNESKGDNEMIVLTEGDATFIAQDIAKLSSFIVNVDMVVGTRNTIELVDKETQLSAFYYLGNYFLAKLLHIKFFVRFTDVGCTYRMIRPHALRKIIDKLDSPGHVFSPHMINQALKNDLIVIEIPVTFKQRVGQSKGANANVGIATVTGFKMWYEILK